MIHCWRVTHPNVVHFDVSVTLTLVCACPTSPPFQDARAANPSHNLSQPAVVLRKRRPSQREGLPTKDLCTPTPQTKSNSCHPPQSEGSAIPQHRKTGCPTSRALRDVAVGKWEDAANQSSCTRKHDPFVYGGHSCPPPSPKSTTAPHRTELLSPRWGLRALHERYGGCANWKIAG